MKAPFFFAVLSILFYQLITLHPPQFFSKNEAVRSPLWGTHGWFSLLEGCNAGTAEAQMTKFSMYFLLRRRESRIFSRLPSKARSSTSMHTGPS